MGMYFGTDGIRGEYGSFITPSLAFKCGCSLASLCHNQKVLIARDTRTTGDILTLSVANGLMSCGIDVVDIGITPTPVVSFLTEKLGCDFGIVISASHNPPSHNGIKIFDGLGYKITEEEENKIENFFSFSQYVQFDKVGHYQFKPTLINLYKKKVLLNCTIKNKLKIVIDCANGATFSLAKKIFPVFCREVVFIADNNDGANINQNCGALHPENLAKHIAIHNANLGFSFDGDGDRIIMCDKNGRTFDGDDILCLLSSTLSKEEKYVVGTTMTNKGLEEYLTSKNITLLRSDVGDKYVSEVMKNRNISLGGEPSGHIIMKKFSKTGDAIGTACAVLQILSIENFSTNEIVTFKKYPQINKNIEVKDKFRILNSDLFKQKIADFQEKLKGEGRILVRASGTESKIRIMCECLDEVLAGKIVQEIESIILQIK